MGFDTTRPLMQANAGGSPDKDRKMSKEEWENTAIRLWKLLDDIDTASDIFKPEHTNFYRRVISKAEERFNYLASDGHSLYPARMIEGDEKAHKEKK